MTQPAASLYLIYMNVRSIVRRDVRPAAALVADQYRRWHEADPRLSLPRDIDEAAYLLLDFDWDNLDNSIFVAEDEAGIAGYLGVSTRRYDVSDPQRIWLPDHHGHCEIFYGFAARADLDPGAVFSELFAAARRKVGPGEPWVIGLVPEVAGLDEALLALGCYKSSAFGYRSVEPLPDIQPPNGITIRPAVRDELPRLVELLDALHVYHQENDPRLDRPMSDAQEQMRWFLNYIFKRPADWVLLVADAAGEGPVGLALAGLDSEETGPKIITRFPEGSTSLIHEFYVDDAWRGKGVGRALFAATAQAALKLPNREFGQRRLAGLWVIYRVTNPTSSRFWPSVGFKPLYNMWRLGGWQ